MGIFSLGEKLIESAANIVDKKLNSSENELKKQLRSLEQLKKLYDSGAITEKEYNKKKKQILNSKH